MRTSLGDFSYDKLLFVTGGRPKGIDLDEGERVICFRESNDYRRQRDLSGRNLSIAATDASAESSW